ncbi:shikimate dehydrogenase [Thermodesulforhabdus norvegica]|uniref:Shikimate dehydrogenase (NADP(+)) n=1 Tax=Thermodesulforhabdus norvegica TaxID=39841 RepID=A0A1I4RMP2_9BACT|nr:shikimate dehydrogenase [Thermodesulforhabdus norvegica]SFM53250.1 shikimate dehydrogenase [Thermodesulforhabdus norvegica]
MIRCVQTRLFAVIGHPVKHSLSPAMMNAAFRALDIPAFYLALEVSDFLEDMKHITALGFDGLSVTIPHKESAMKLAVVDDEAARAIGAVNCLKRVDDVWRGKNTDWIGVVDSFKSRGIDISGKKALVLGAGGAARGVIYAALKMGAEVTVVNRTDEKAFSLADEFGINAVEHKSLKERVCDFQVVFQTTPVGMNGYPVEHFWPYDIFRPGMIVMDLVYRPAKTAFMKSAEERGCTVISGLDMLLYQGVAQFEWWFDRPAPLEAMKKALYEAAEQDDHV